MGWMRMSNHTLPGTGGRPTGQSPSEIRRQREQERRRQSEPNPAPEAPTEQPQGSPLPNPVTPKSPARTPRPKDD